MGLIAISTDDPGVVRIFFDLVPSEPSREQELRIASAIEHAFTKPKESPERVPRAA